MKTKRLVAMLIAIAIAMCLFVMPSSAAGEAEQTHTNIEIIFEDETLSEEFKARATAHFLNGAPEDDGTATYGLTCTLFGHKLETGTTTTITHKARATAPRCLEQIYNYSACTRCDYEASTLKSSTYIHCCS